MLAHAREPHQANTARGAQSVIADSKYGTIDNYLACYDRGVAAHLPDLKKERADRLSSEKASNSLAI